MDMDKDFSDKYEALEYDEILFLKKTIQEKNELIYDLEVRNKKWISRCLSAETQLRDLENAFFWKISKPLRRIIDRLKTIARKYPQIYLELKTIKWALKYGIKDSNGRKKAFLVQQSKTEIHSFSGRAKVDMNLKFIIVPSVNAADDCDQLAMIRSLREQSFSNWEMIIVNRYNDVPKDDRIRYVSSTKEARTILAQESTNETELYIVKMKNGDRLHKEALSELAVSINETNADILYTDEKTACEDTPRYKPDYSPDYLRSINYIGHLIVFKRQFLEAINDLDFQSDINDYEVILRLSEFTKNIIHIPKVLYFSNQSRALALPEYQTRAQNALARHLSHIGLKGTVLEGRAPGTFYIKYDISDSQLVSIIIPNKDHLDDLKKCIDSILQKTTYQNYEIIIIENNSESSEIFQYYNDITLNGKIRIVKYEGLFNYSKINNYGVENAKGDIVLLLNNDTEVISNDWIEQMLMFSQRSDVGAVGCMLYYPDESVQHGGVIIGLGGIAGHAHKNYYRNDNGYMNRLNVCQNFSAVTAACMMVKKCVWEEVGGLEEKFAVAFNDVDFCMRIRLAGYLVVWTPYAELYHYESKSRGQEDTYRKKKRFNKEIKHFREKWGEELILGDPYYNPNLSLDTESFSA